jgi:hypothetical protein
VRNCSQNAIPKMPTAPAIGTLRCPIASDIASPMPVVSSLSAQKISPISGTLTGIVAFAHKSRLKICDGR